MSTDILCKFRVASIKRVKYHDSVPEQRVVEMTPVYGNSPENKKFFDSTPSGKLEFTTSNLEAIDGMDLSKEYYINICDSRQIPFHKTLRDTLVNYLNRIEPEFIDKHSASLIEYFKEQSRNKGKELSDGSEVPVGVDNSCLIGVINGFIESHGGEPIWAIYDTDKEKIIKFD